MKKTLYAVIFVILAIVSIKKGWGEEPVYFPDANFKAAVESALGIINPTPTDMIGLTSLHAMDKRIVDITGIGYAVNLTTLNICGNQISSLPGEIGNLTNLTYLDLANSQLSSLPSEIGNLTNLTWLNLWDNQLSSLPAEIGNLTNLTDLILEKNQLSSLPIEIWNLTNLAYLGLFYNQLTSLPAEIGNLTNLTRLDLYSNQLSSLPLEIGNLTHLMYLGLERNPLNTEVYCNIIPFIINNNPGIDIRYDTNPNYLSNDCSTDLFDFGIFQNHWLEIDCGPDNNWCGGADLNHINNVDIEDVVILCSYWLAGKAEAVEYTISQITDNEYNNAYPKINNGRVIWEGNGIWFYDTIHKTTTQISMDGSEPQIDGDYIVWASGQIFLYNLATGTTTNISNNSYSNYQPQIDGDYIVWRRGSSHPEAEIFLYNITTGITTQLSDNEYQDLGPQIDNGKVVWEGLSGAAGIYFYDTATEIRTQISTFGWIPQIDDGQVVWQRNGIWLYDTINKTTNQISTDGCRAQIDNGQVVWEGGPWPRNIFHYDIATGNMIQLSNNDIYLDYAPQIDNGQVVWEEEAGYPNWKIFLYDPTTGTTTNIAIITDNFFDRRDTSIDQTAHINSGQIVWHAGFMGNYQIFLAERIEQEPRVLYVDDNASNDPVPGDPTESDPSENGSADHPFDSIQEAIETTVDGDIVLVRDGTYTGTGNRDIDFLGKAITVRSENGPETCIINCQATYEDYHMGVYLQNGESKDSILDGFTITNAQSSFYGGGIFCFGSSPTILNNIITGNKSMFDGGGGGIACLGGSPTIINNIIVGNHGGSTGYGGGILCDNSSAIISNNTICGNVSWFEGGVLWYGLPPTITNCIIRGNTSMDGTASDINDSSVATYCCIQGVSSGEGNIDDDPYFVQLGYWNDNNTPDRYYDDIWIPGDYHLLPNSPCIDSGNNEAIAGISTDIEGNLRIINTTVDMGAYEYAFIIPQINAMVNITPHTLNKKSNGQWITAYITLPEGYNVADIDVNSIAITSIVGDICSSEYNQPADLSFTPQIGDRDEDGITDLTVKFDRQLLIPNFCLDDVEITIEGSLDCKVQFSGKDKIRVIERGK